MTDAEIIANFRYKEQKESECKDHEIKKIDLKRVHFVQELRAKLSATLLASGRADCQTVSSAAKIAAAIMKECGI